MNPPSLLTGLHLRTYNTIFQHPISHNLKWHDVYALFGQLGEIKEEANGNMKVTRNGQILVLHPHLAKDVSETDEVMVLRHFIEQSETMPQQESKKIETHWLVVIDHHQARLFRSEMHGAIPQQILPHKPEDYFRHAHNSKDFTKGQEKPDPNSYFEPVARALATGGKFLIFGTGTGMSSEMDQFISWLKVHHHELSQRMIGSQVVDEYHLTENQLLAKAREFYANPRI